MRYIIIAIMSVVIPLSIHPAKYYISDGSIIFGELQDVIGDSAIINTKHGDLIFSLDDIYTSPEKMEIKQILWKRHFFDLSLANGMTIVELNHYGVHFGIQAGYLYGINKYFALGTGIQASLSYCYYDKSYNNEWFSYTNRGTDFTFSIVPVQLFMIGDLKDKKIAFLLDMGAGLYAAIKMGIYIKGFTIKAGYCVSGLVPAHNIVFDFGYKFNWKRKLSSVKTRM